MPIKYSLSARLMNPSEKDSEKRVYPMAQYTELMNMTEFARHIQSHGSPFTRDVIVGVLTAAVDENLFSVCRVATEEGAANESTQKQRLYDKSISINKD